MPAIPPILSRLDPEHRNLIGVLFGIALVAALVRWSMIKWVGAARGDEPWPLRLILSMLDRRSDHESAAGYEGHSRTLYRVSKVAQAIYLVFLTLGFLVLVGSLR